MCQSTTHTPTPETDCYPTVKPAKEWTRPGVLRTIAPGSTLAVEYPGHWSGKERRNRMHKVYLAHPYGGNKSLLDNAERILVELSDQYRALFFAPWISICRQWPESKKERGILLDLEYLSEMTGLLAIYPHKIDTSSGMSIEISRAQSMELQIVRSYSEGPDPDWTALQHQLSSIGIYPRDKE